MREPDCIAWAGPKSAAEAVMHPIPIAGTVFFYCNGDDIHCLAVRRIREQRDHVVAGNIRSK
jgi:hypothetical protein